MRWGDKGARKRPQQEKKKADRLARLSYERMVKYAALCHLWSLLKLFLKKVLGIVDVWGLISLVQSFSATAMLYSEFGKGYCLIHIFF